VGSDPVYGLMDLPDLAPGGGGLSPSVLEHEQEIERAHQTVPWPLLEVGVVPNARGNRRVSDLKQKGIQGSQQQANIGAELPRDRLRTYDEALDLVLAGEETADARPRICHSPNLDAGVPLLEPLAVRR